MKTLILTALSLAGLMMTASLAAQQGTNNRTWERMSLEVDGVRREALVIFPAEKTGDPPPLVFGFHGHGGKAQGAARKFRIQKFWPEALVVYPQGLPTPGRLTDPEGKRSGWQHGAGEMDDRDLDFFDALRAELADSHPYDENRVYATGHSNGGGFSYLLWASRPGVFAAIAPSAAGSGALRTGNPQPLPVMHIAGRNDTLVKFEWQSWTMRRVCEINDCGEDGEAWAEVCTSFAGVKIAPLVSCVHDGTHAYPDIAPELIVRFFKEHRRPG